MAETAAAALDTLTSASADQMIEELERLENEDSKTVLEQSPQGYHVLREEDHVAIVDWNPEDGEIRVLDITQSDSVKDAMMP